MIRNVRELNLLKKDEVCRVKKYILPIFTLLLGFILGFICCVILYHTSTEGMTLTEDVTLYNLDEPIASIKEGTVMYKDRLLPEGRFCFALFKSKFKVHEKREVYYQDYPITKREPLNAPYSSPAAGSKR